MLKDIQSLVEKSIKSIGFSIDGKYYRYAPSSGEYNRVLCTFIEELDTPRGSIIHEVAYISKVPLEAEGYTFKEYVDFFNIKNCYLYVENEYVDKRIKITNPSHI